MDYVRHTAFLQDRSSVIWVSQQDAEFVADPLASRMRNWVKPDALRLVIQ